MPHQPHSDLPLEGEGVRLFGSEAYGKRPINRLNRIGDDITFGLMQGQTNHSILRPNLQRRLRNAPTDAERALWQRLRGRQLCGCKFRRQHPFGDYILDFVCLERKLVIELDGGQHADSIATDEVRSEFLEHAGFMVLRFWNNHVFSEMDSVLECIWSALARDTPSPPQPSP
jgi:very-short-patch-repair endonuclease